MTGYDGIQLLLDFAQDAWGVDSRKVPVHVFTDDFDERKKLRQ